jgi:hypothetical protein
VRHLPLEERRDTLRRRLMPKLGDSIRYSETFDVPAAELVEPSAPKGLRASSPSAAPALTGPATALGIGSSSVSTRDRNS